jgi:bifunctional ADP-heptose synthase (sugar kinase/adenylyltransferase)
VKTRLLAGGQSVARFDRGGRGGPPIVTDEMLDTVLAADAVLVSDYGRGLTANDRLRGLLTWIAKHKPVVWDPHPRGSEPVPGVAAGTPNLVEATSATGLIGETVPVAEQAAAVLRSRWQADAVTVTLGADGALVHEGCAARLIPADRVDVGDPCGAGDRFASVLAARLMSGAGTVEATRTAVQQSASFLAEGGVSTFDSYEEQSCLLNLTTQGR